MNGTEWLKRHKKLLVSLSDLKLKQKEINKKVNETKKLLNEFDRVLLDLEI